MCVCEIRMLSFAELGIKSSKMYMLTPIIVSKKYVCTAHVLVFEHDIEHFSRVSRHVPLRDHFRRFVF